MIEVSYNKEDYIDKRKSLVCKWLHIPRYETDITNNIINRQEIICDRCDN